jgi:general secretion pathway protein F/type IV pilus assembly protein PilC
MASYQYIARTPKGEEVTGVMQADNESAVLHALDERQLYPVRVVAQQAARRKAGGRIRLRDLAVMYGQLADLLRSGVPLLRSLEILVRASSNRKLAEIIAGVHGQVNDGKALAEAMSGHPRIFNSLHLAMIRAGERGGFLEDVLANMAGYLDRADDLRSKIRGAMIYPLVLTCLGTIAITGILVFLVPLFRSVFANMALPLPTRVLFALSSILLEQWPAVLAVLVLAVLGVLAGLRSQAGKRIWDSWQLRLPIAGPLIRGLCITRFCRILGTLLHSGVPILQSLTISKDAAGSMRLAQNIETATENVRAGDKLAPPLLAGGLFPADVVEMIAVAEESNQLEKVLLQVADNTERRVNRTVDAVVRLVEPLILVVIAGAIAFVAIGLLYPIFTMSRALRTR